MRRGAERSRAQLPGRHGDVCRAPQLAAGASRRCCPQLCSWNAGCCCSGDAPAAAAAAPRVLSHVGTTMMVREKKSHPHPVTMATTTAVFLNTNLERHESKEFAIIFFFLKSFLCACCLYMGIYTSQYNIARVRLCYRSSLAQKLHSAPGSQNAFVRLL